MALVDTATMAQILGVKTSWLRDSYRRLKVPFIKLGERLIRFDTEAVLRHFQSGQDSTKAA